MLYSCQKSQLGAELESLVTIPDTDTEADVIIVVILLLDVIIVDGSALVNSLQPRSSKLFEEYEVNEVLLSPSFLLQAAQLSSEGV